MSHYVVAWFWAFAFTQLVEIPIYRRALACSSRAAFGASALTHPVVWFVIFPYSTFGYAWTLLGAELFAWLAEAMYFARRFGMRRAIAVALLANLASCLLGFLSRRLFGVP